jgi:predicted nuclease of restriction endonuclease-like (RecB) superfamily
MIMNFDELIKRIDFTSNYLKESAVSAVNISLTIRNWMVGYFIVEFEQNGEDRAEYGKKLLGQISKTCSSQGIKGYSISNLKYFRQFYLSYNRIRQSVIGQLDLNSKSQSVIGLLGEKHASEITKLRSRGHFSQEVDDIPVVDADKLLSHLSYTHFVELMTIDDKLKRTFYEIECINGNWSVRELKRQIGSLLYERTGLSRNKQKVIDIANQVKSDFLPENIIRDPYIFEFLGLKQQEVFTENTLEDLLIANLQDFILELGIGFCFEVRQKRIQIDNEYYYIDLVFYHKILKCNVLFELKTRKFRHSDLSQLNVYLNYYKKHEMQADDNLPVGILLCTEKDKEMVEFATAGLDQNLFVSKYQLFIPSKQELESFIKNQIIPND